MNNDLTIEDIEIAKKSLVLAAAKQLLLEMLAIKNQINGSNAIITSILVVQLKAVALNNLKRYQEQGLFEGENITLKLSDKSRYAKVDFLYSPGLLQLINQVKEEQNA